MPSDSIPPTSKRCTSCGETKPLSEFYASKSNKDGKTSDCKLCYPEKVRRRRQANAARTSIPVYYTEKCCTRCGQIKPLAAFHADRARKDGMCPYCKCCAQKKSSGWYEKNKDRVRESVKRWIEANKDRKRETDKRWREANKDRRRETHKRWIEANKDRYRETSKRWYEANRDRIRETSKRWHEKFPERARAIRAVGKAIKRGLLEKPEYLLCHNCWAPATDLHHPSYLPEHHLHVIPLCPSCHRLEHVRWDRGETPRWLPEELRP